MALGRELKYGVCESRSAGFFVHFEDIRQSIAIEPGKYSIFLPLIGADFVVTLNRRCLATASMAFFRCLSSDEVPISSLS